MSEVNNTDITSESYDAQQTTAEIDAGDRKAPSANVEADYEASKQFSTSPIDDTEAGTQAATAATAPQFDLPTPDDTTLDANTTGNPDDYKQLAHDIGRTSEGVGNVSDELVQKALEKGKAGSKDS